MSYDATILAETGLVAFWKLNEGSGTTAADSQGTNTGTYEGTAGTNYTLAQTGIGDTETAVLFDGTAGFVQTASHITRPVLPFSLECWFKVANGPTAGGGLLAFTSVQGATAGSFSGYTLFLDNAGKVNFITDSGSNILVSPTAYNDGNWHHAVGTATSSGMTLYVDGASVVSGVYTGNFSFTGWWHIGWADANWIGTFHFLAGTLAKPAVYSAALTSTQVTNHFNAASGGGGSPVIPPLRIATNWAAVQRSLR